MLGIGLMTPDQVHYGQADAVHAARQETLDRRLRGKSQSASSKSRQTPPNKPTAVWINPPARKRKERSKSKLKFQIRLSHFR